jgi:hypothetical protein
MPDRGALRDTLALRPDDLDNLFLEQLGEQPSPTPTERASSPSFAESTSSPGAS